jgi:hypothetical protein
MGKWRFDPCTLFLRTSIWLDIPAALLAKSLSPTHLVGAIVGHSNGLETRVNWSVLHLKGIETRYPTLPAVTSVSGVYFELDTCRWCTVPIGQWAVWRRNWFQFMAGTVQQIWFPAAVKNRMYDPYTFLNIFLWSKTAAAWIWPITTVQSQI